MRGPMISVGDLTDDGLRWFRAVRPEQERYGKYHLGPSPSWPVKRAICGYAQRDTVVGRQVTQASVTAHEGDFCTKCLRAYERMAAR